VPSRSTSEPRRRAGAVRAGRHPCYLRLELNPPHVVAYRLGSDGLYEEAGRAAPGRILTLTEPFPIEIDPAALLR
jgi:hypothetical protein